MKITHPYTFNKEYQKAVAYFSMEFAIDQSLKIYSGGLGFLAGSHMRSAYDQKQNMVGIGMLWKYGYYEQVRKPNNELGVLNQEKHYTFLQETGIELSVIVHDHEVKVKAFYLDPKIFGTAPMYFLSTDHPDNDHLSHSITHKLYDDNLATRIAQYIILGVGGVKLLEALGHETEVYHLNEAHGLPAAFYLLERLKTLDKLKKQLVFTTHTPVKAGNEVNDPALLEKMSYFHHLSAQEVEKLVGFENGSFNHTLAALRMSRKANAVSKKHQQVSNVMWGGYKKICKIEAITNAQNKDYWTDIELEKAYQKGNSKAYDSRKKKLKVQLFEEVADQTGKLFDPEILTIVWARRFAGYKRADLVLRRMEQFTELLNGAKYPIQIIWAGKPYPLDEGAVNTFNHLVHFTRPYSRATVLTGYELKLSSLMKKGSDIWLNTPRVPMEASGTSGMAAAMNGSVNFSTNDGWVLEFACHGKNSFVIPEANKSFSQEKQDEHDAHHLFDILQNEILPTYYDQPEKWMQIAWQATEDVQKGFTSARMVDDYYKKLYAR
ncbi:alpha-glucan family phosphorylase [Fulvivirga sp. M361]|uniref:alpha-glucan family phosphorylase n=1 Tax=Fulvivirga sp. M361 TaxID=2594266 RepID=UPI00117B1CB0|nr:alpha-glucan family phosphorylase [Fulvivirga sp. M361]TRX58793.1 alpha-glucan family phosphorylase [Fulvivirga sp. M361]